MTSTRRIELLLVLVAACAMSACAVKPAVRTVYRPVTLPIPVRPKLVPIRGSDVACLDDVTYRALVGREQALRQWGLKLQAVIVANNAKTKK